MRSRVTSQSAAAAPNWPNLYHCHSCHPCGAPSSPPSPRSSREVSWHCLPHAKRLGLKSVLAVAGVVIQHEFIKLFSHTHCTECSTSEPPPNFTFYTALKSSRRACHCDVQLTHSAALYRAPGAQTESLLDFCPSKKKHILHRPGCQPMTKLLSSANPKQQWTIPARHLRHVHTLFARTMKHSSGGQI